MKRPTVVTVFAILNLVFGGLGILGTPLALLMFYLPQRPGAPPDLMTKLLKENETARYWFLGSGVVAMVAAAVLLVAGLGLLKMKPWGRRVSIGYAVFAIVMNVVGAVANYVLLVVPLMEAAGKAGGLQAFAAMIMGVSFLAGSVMGMVYPIVLLVFMTRPPVVQAFQPPEGSSPYDRTYDPGFR
jgi:hypothetical protein